MQIITADWLTRTETCERIGISPKTLEEWVRRGVIHSRREQRKGRSPERLFEAADVERLRKAKLGNKPFPAEAPQATQLELGTDQEEWIPTAQAAMLIGKSARSLDRLVEGKELRSRLANGRRLYAVSDLTRIRDARGVVAAPKPEPAPASPDLVLVLRDLLGEQQAARAERERARAESRLWLSLDEAAAYSGLERATLRRAIEEEKLTAIKGRAWSIRRASLEAYAG